MTIKGRLKTVGFAIEPPIEIIFTFFHFIVDPTHTKPESEYETDDK